MHLLRGGNLLEREYCMCELHGGYVQHTCWGFKLSELRRLRSGHLLNRGRGSCIYHLHCVRDRDLFIPDRRRELHRLPARNFLCSCRCVSLGRLLEL